MQNIYGSVCAGMHVDTSKTLNGAKRYATLHGIDNVSIRYNCGYVVEVIFKKINNKWVKKVN